VKAVSAPSTSAATPLRLRSLLPVSVFGCAVSQSIALAILALVQPVSAQATAQNPVQNPVVQNPVVQNPVVQNPVVQNPVIKVGVVQRFAAQSSDAITLKPMAGDRLTLSFKSSDQTQSITTADPVRLEIVAQPHAQPQVVEQVVLSTHRSFESAEDSANEWRAKGIEVEIAQPQQWQVWAKRDTYRSPLLRRLLMQNLRANGAKTAFIDQKIERQNLQASFVVGGNRYLRDQITVDTTTNRVEVTFNRGDHGRKIYGGNLNLQPNAYGDYTLVNNVPIETYLRGVVPHEIGASAPPSAIEAQAILARTYALRNLRRFAIDNYQMCADTQCQVYWGLGETDAASDRAIANTYGSVLVYNNELVDALYSSTTGGVTAPFEDVWNGEQRPYLKAVVDSVNSNWDLTKHSLADEQNFRTFLSHKKGFNEEGWDMFRWKIKNSMADISQDVRSYLRSKQHPLANFTQITNLEVTQRSLAGRVQQMRVTTDRGVIQLEKDEIMRALYAPNSTFFYLEPIYEAPAAPAAAPKKVGDKSAIATTPAPKGALTGYNFVGGGFGHGVGMSQTGAYRLGKLGWAGPQILGFYFPGAQVVPLTDGITFWRDAKAAAWQINSHPLARSLQ
jgi:SpoIID/LytB domain protein